MAACVTCGGSIEEAWIFCPSCGTRAKPGPGGVRVHLEDVITSCARCGVEAAYGKLVRCGVDHERACKDCTKTCDECQGVACVACMRDCATCGKVGCASCYPTCESCHVRSLCPDHDPGCEECAYPTCERCMVFCKNCEVEVCKVCFDEFHEKKRVRS